MIARPAGQSHQAKAKRTVESLKLKLDGFRPLCSPLTKRSLQAGLFASQALDGVGAGRGELGVPSW